MDFLSSDGFPITLDGAVEFRVMPEKVAEVFVKYNEDDNGDEIDEEIIAKIITPESRSLCRIGGSKLTGGQFISGERPREVPARPGQEPDRELQEAGDRDPRRGDHLDPAPRGDRRAGPAPRGRQAEARPVQAGEDPAALRGAVEGPGGPGRAEEEAGRGRAGGRREDDQGRAGAEGRRDPGRAEAQGRRDAARGRQGQGVGHHRQGAGRGRRDPLQQQGRGRRPGRPRRGVRRRRLGPGAEHPDRQARPGVPHHPVELRGAAHGPLRPVHARARSPHRIQPDGPAPAGRVQTPPRPLPAEAQP